jgi:hypothetical protein
MKCAPLRPGALGASASRPGVDPALVWADATAFADFRRPGAPLPTALPVVAERAAGASLARLARRMQLPAAWLGSTTQQFSATVGADFCREWLAGGHDTLVQRFELQLPALPHRARPLRRRVAAAAAPGWRRATSDPAQPVLLGVIDCGCPFAHRMLRNAAGTGTRVLQLWDQDPHAPAFAGHGGVRPPDFGYGAEIARPALDTLMAAAASAADPRHIDEARCYRRAGCHDLLRWRFGHGAAVLGLLTAPRALDQGPLLRSGGCTDAASQADIVFVQIPRDAVQDSGSASLPRYVIDGLRYIVGCAAPGQRVVVNISDGSSRGSHDGQSIIERAMVALVAERKAAGGALEIVIAAGNTHDEERHVQFDDFGTGQPQRAWLRVPPANESSVFVTLRLPTANAGALRVRVTPPGVSPDESAAAWAGVGQALGFIAAHHRKPAAGLVLAQPLPGMAALGLLAIAPTRRGASGRPTAPAGDWCIEIQALPGSTPAEPVHLWVSRGQRNATALPRSWQARFIDTDRGYDPAPHLRPLKHDPDPPRSPIRRAGTLNSLATLPCTPGITVAGAAFRRELVATDYTSAGPAAGLAATVRGGPDLAATVDDDQGLRSLRLAGNASGSVSRGSGSSFAAPQVARLIALGQRPREQPRGDAQRLGQGVIPP